MAPLDPANIIASRLQVMEDSDLLYLIFSHLDPNAVKEAALVSKYVLMRISSEIIYMNGPIFDFRVKITHN